MAAGKAYFELVPKLGSTTDFKASLAAIKTDGMSAELGKSLGKGMVKGLAALGIGKLIADTIADSLKAYADYEQLVGGVETLFKDSADVVEKYAANAYKTAGLSANQYMEAVTGFSGALLRSLGGDTEAAAKMADMAITDMSDQANKYGMSVDRVKDTYMSLARGQFMTLDNLFGGMFAGTKKGLRDMLDYAEQYRASLGETVSYSEDSYADIVSAIHDVSESLGVAGTTAKEASTTILGAFNMVKASWQNVLVAMADPNADLSAVFGDMVSSISTLLKNAIPVIGEIATQLIIQLPDAVVELAPVLLEAVGQMLLSVGEKLEAWMEEVMLAFANWFLECLDGIGQWFVDMGNAISSGIDSVVEWFATLPSRIMELLNSLIDEAYSAGVSLVTSFGEGILSNFSAAEDPLAMLMEASSGYFTHSPAKKGAFSGKGYPLYSGMNMADALGEGFTKRIGSVTRQIAAGMDSLASTINGGVTNNTSISMSVTADSTTTLDNLVAQARRARALNGGY